MYELRPREVGVTANFRQDRVKGPDFECVMIRYGHMMLAVTVGCLSEMTSARAIHDVSQTLQ